MYDCTFLGAGVKFMYLMVHVCISFSVMVICLQNGWTMYCVSKEDLYRMCCYKLGLEECPSWLVANPGAP